MRGETKEQIFQFHIKLIEPNDDYNYCLYYLLLVLWYSKIILSHNHNEDYQLIIDFQAIRCEMRKRRINHSNYVR